MPFKKNSFNLFYSKDFQQTSKPSRKMKNIIQLIITLIVSLLIISCSSSDDKDSETKITEKETPNPEPEPEVSVDTETPDEPGYQERYGDARVIPKAFKEYQEWGEFVYNDQLLEMYQKRIKDSDDDIEKINALQEQIQKAYEIKESAFNKMSERLNRQN